MESQLQKSDEFRMLNDRQGKSSVYTIFYNSKIIFSRIKVNYDFFQGKMYERR